MIRLGEGVDASGTISEASMERLINALSNFHSLCEQFSVEVCVVVGTSASRDAGAGIVSVVRERSGMDYHILSGDQEADLSFEGAVGGLSHVQGNIVTCDIGGGSTEFVEGTSEGLISERMSLDIGSVRITERFFSSQPPKFAELEAAREFIHQSLSRLPFSGNDSTVLVGASDTHRLLLELQHAVVSRKSLMTPRLLEPAWERLIAMGAHPEILTYEQVELWMECLTQMTVHDVLSLDAKKLKGRADVFPAATLIFLEVMCKLKQKKIIVSPWGLCHGIALRMLRKIDFVHDHSSANLKRLIEFSSIV